MTASSPPDPAPVPPAPPAPSRADAVALAGLAALLAAFVALTWAKWPMVTADSARELYVPFQIRHGAVMYRDFQYLYGPVAPYFQAGLLWAFGERLAVLYAASALHLAAITGLLYGIARQVLPVRPAFAVAVLFLAQFALGRDLQGYMWPYAFAATYGVLLGLAQLLALLRHLRTGRAGWLVAAGLAAGLSAVTKLEYGAAAGALGLAYLAGRLIFRRGLVAAGPWWREAAAWGVPAAATAGAVAATVLALVPLPTVLESVWPRRLMAMWNSQGQWHGTFATWKENLRWFGLAFGALALCAGHQRLLDGLRRSWAVRGAAAAGVLAAVAFALGKADRLAYLWTWGPQFWVGPSFVVLVGVLAVQGWRLGAAWRAGRAIPPEAVAWLLIAGYGLLVAVRTVFRGMNEYTGYQAPVALVAWVALAVAWLPGAIGTPGSAGRARAMATLLLLLLVGRHGADAAAVYGRRHVPVEGPPGMLWSDPAFGDPFNAALAFVRRELKPGENVVAAPIEASFFTFLGRDNPVRENQIFYGYLTTPAEQDEYIERLRAANVRFFVLSSYGYPGKRWGEDFQRELAAWLRDACTEAATFDSGLYRMTVYETPFARAGQAREVPAGAGEAGRLRVLMPARPAPR